MCNRSDSISKIAAALVAFSGEVKSIAHDSENPHFKSQYTSLDHMIDETKPILTKHGLTVMQFPGGDGERVTVRTMVLHLSGEWIESEPLTLKAVKMDPQGAGSAITYARRYSYAAALSLSLGDDDDGNASSHAPQGTRNAGQAHGQNHTGQQEQAPTGHTGASSDPSKRVYAIMNELKWKFDDVQNFASDLFGRPIRHLKNQVKDDEWNELYEGLKKHKETGWTPVEQTLPF